MSCKGKRHEQLCWGQATVRNPLQEKYKATLTSYYNINFLVTFSCLAERSPPVLQSTFLIFPSIFLLIPDLIAMKHPEIAPECWVSLHCWLSPAKSVSEGEGGEERRGRSRACSPTALGPAVARVLLARDLHSHTHTFPQGCQNASVQSQHPGEEAGMHLNYFSQKISKMFNCSKSILITTRWISDGNFLSFLPAYPPPRSQGNPARAARNSHLLGNLPGTQPKKSLWLWLPDSPALQFPRH